MMPSDPPPGETVLEEAQRLVTGPRQASYGSPYDDHTRVGIMWAVILGLDEPIPPHVVSLMMVLVKVSREANAHSRDNLVDIAGYAYCSFLEKQEEDRR